MKRIFPAIILKFLTVLLFILTTSIICYASVTMITGAGATFPYPIYAKWAQMYQKQSNLQLNYQSIGSGAGIKQIIAKTVDFGASDKPLNADQLQKNNLVQFPTVIGAIVPIINITGVNSGLLKLSGEVLANIYLGTTKKWNDPAIVALNPGLALPDQAITVVHRSDGSGTTFLFTDYLSKVSSNWKSQVGSDTAVAWPYGIGGKGNEGVSVFVKQTPGSIGYVEYAYAKLANLNVVQLKNQAGQFVEPTLISFKSAAQNFNWKSAADFDTTLTNSSGANDWPIVGATFILVNSVSTNPDKTKAILNFFAWSFQNGANAAIELNYVPLSDNAVTLVKNVWKTNIKDANGNPIWQ